MIFLSSISTHSDHESLRGTHEILHHMFSILCIKCCVTLISILCSNLQTNSQAKSQAIRQEFSSKIILFLKANVDADKRRARLVFGNATAAQAGKYRCEIRTDEGELVFGNMFAYCKWFPSHVPASLSLGRFESSKELNALKPSSQLNF